MAPNMITLFTHIQQDLNEQKETTRNNNVNFLNNLNAIKRNLSSLNTKFNLMESRISQLENKIDLQQSTIQTIDQYLKNNNSVRKEFTDIPKSVETNDCRQAGLLVRQSQKYTKNIKLNQTQNPSKVSNVEDAQRNCESESDHDQFYNNKDKADDRNKDNSTAGEMKEIKDLIKGFIASQNSIKEVHKEGTGPVSLAYFNSHIEELKRICDTNQSKMREINELIKNSGASKTYTGQEDTEYKQVTVQISPTYFTADQLGKLNAELKLVSDKYRSMNILPLIKVIPGACENHPVMKRLSKGVIYKATSPPYNNRIAVKLGLNGLKRSEVLDMVTEYPDMTLYDVVKELLSLRNVWNNLSDKYDFNLPLQYDR